MPRTTEMTKEEKLELLHESGVINEFAHFEDGEFHTAITSAEELFKLIELAFERGMSACYY